MIVFMSREKFAVVESAPERVLVMAASTRTGSINQALARRIAEHIDRVAEPAGVVGLSKYPMPLYDSDLESRDGVPAAAVDLAARIAAAEVLVIVTPEYNGAFPPLLKNTIDWLTRVDTAVLAHLTVLVASASPGQGGGSKAVAMVRDWMTNIGVADAERTLSIGSAGFDGGDAIAPVHARALSDFADQATLAAGGVTP